jgi:hypothetical protein
MPLKKIKDIPKNINTLQGKMIVILLRFEILGVLVVTTKIAALPMNGIVTNCKKKNASR